jgi:hypothetical protein
MKGSFCVSKRTEECIHFTIKKRNCRYQRDWQGWGQRAAVAAGVGARPAVASERLPAGSLLSSRVPSRALDAVRELTAR